MRSPFVPARALLKAPAYSTGVSVLDKLLKGLRQGSTYLFYGDEAPLSSLLYSAVASVVKAGRRALIVTARDYHRGYILDTYELGNALLNAGLDPEEAMEEVLVANIYNVRQTQLADKIVKLAARNRVGLVAVMYATELFKYKDYPALIAFLGRLKEVLKSEAALSIFAARSPLSKRPLPDGPVFLRHFASAIVRLEEASKEFVRAWVEKGPCPTPTLAYIRRRWWVLEDVEGWF